MHKIPSLSDDELDRFWRNVEKSADGCWNWTACHQHWGYGTIRFRNRQLRAHRISWSIAYGSIPDGLIVCHGCDNPGCVRPDHLFLGTHKDNAVDRVQKVRNTRMLGAENPSTRLTAEQVREIRRRYVPRVVSYAMLAREYGVGHHTVEAIVTRTTWRHLNDAA